MSLPGLETLKSHFGQANGPVLLTGRRIFFCTLCVCWYVCVSACWLVAGRSWVEKKYLGQPREWTHPLYHTQRDRASSGVSLYLSLNLCLSLLFTILLSCLKTLFSALKFFVWINFSYFFSPFSNNFCLISQIVFWGGTNQIFFITSIHYVLVFNILCFIVKILAPEMSVLQAEWFINDQTCAC